MLRRSMAESKAAAMPDSRDFPQLHSVQRIARIPFIESGLTVATNIYTRIKTSNPLFHWGLDQAEYSVLRVLDTTKPAVNLFNLPLTMIDGILCKSLDLVEEKVPVVTLPPELIFVSTKEYVSKALVKPVLKRADSMKQFGLHQATTVLSSKYTSYAASQLDSALTIADKYVDQYLPADQADGPQGESTDYSTDEKCTYSQAAHAIHHVDIFSRKLQRRLTRRTIAEAKALKKQSVDAITFMMNMAELLAKDPKAAMEKAAILWAHLSEDEPENQARPQNLEQLTVMVSRELARRIVHLVNYARQQASSLPGSVKHTVDHTTATIARLADTVIKRTHLEGAKDLALTVTKQQVVRLQAVAEHLNNLATQILELVAATIAGKQRSQHTNGSANNINSNNTNSTNQNSNNHRHVANNVLHNSFE